MQISTTEPIVAAEPKPEEAHSKVHFEKHTLNFTQRMTGGRKVVLRVEVEVDPNKLTSELRLLCNLNEKTAKTPERRKEVGEAKTKTFQASERDAESIDFGDDAFGD